MEQLQQQQLKAVSHSPHAPPPPSSALSSSSLSQPPPSTAGSPSPLLCALPAAAADRLHGFLGFTQLMDLRCLSRGAARRYEDASLQWMNHHLLKSEEEASSSSSPSSASTPQAPALSSLPFCFDHSDAVWFRQQLSRWRFTCGREDTERCTVSLVDAFKAYGTSSSRWDNTPLSRPGSLTPSYLVQEAAKSLFHKRSAEAVAAAARAPTSVAVPAQSMSAFARQTEGHQAQRIAEMGFWLKRGREDRATSRSARLEFITAYKERLAKERCSADTWKAGPQLSRPLLLLLPAAVAQHSLLAFLTFEDVMDLRAVSRALQPLMEAAAVAQLNRLCPSGLVTIAQQQEKATQLADAARVQAEEKVKQGEERKPKRRSKRKRGSGSVSSMNAAAAMAASVSLVSLTTPSSSSPSSSPSSWSSRSPSSPPPPLHPRHPPHHPPRTP